MKYAIIHWLYRLPSDWKDGQNENMRFILLHDIKKQNNDAPIKDVCKRLQTLLCVCP